MNRKTGLLWIMLITAAVMVTAALTVVYVQCKELEDRSFVNPDGSYSEETVLDRDSNNAIVAVLNEVKLQGSYLKITVTLSRKDGGTFAEEGDYYMGYALELNGNLLGDDYVGRETKLSKDHTRLRMESSVYLRGSKLKGHPAVKVNPQILSGNGESYRGNWILKSHVTPIRPAETIEVDQNIHTSVGDVKVDRLEIDDGAVLMFCSMEDPSVFYNAFMHLTAVDNEGRYYKFLAGDRNENSICLVMNNVDEDITPLTVLKEDVKVLTLSFARDKTLTGGGSQISEGKAFTVSLTADNE